MGQGALSEDDVREILTSNRSHTEQAKRLGVHRNSVRKVRNGEMCRGMATDLPRWGIKCSACAHWYHEACGLGFPDPIQEGLDFARECSCYQVVG